MGKACFRMVCALLIFVCALFSAACAQELMLPESLTAIGEEVFMGSTVLESAVLPEGLKRIESKAFADCTGLSGVITLPSTVTSLDETAFSGCDVTVVINTAE